MLNPFKTALAQKPKYQSGGNDITSDEKRKIPAVAGDFAGAKHFGALNLDRATALATGAIGLIVDMHAGWALSFFGHSEKI
ncbi:MAG: hypothetical protein HYT47_02870 [Candidatus Vogelbacteria bacterium]|nr:hypothetical protein [Candidatus Vogelbacteria bacterium]